MSNTVDNIDGIMAIRDLLEENIQEKQMKIAVYPLVFPETKRPDEFILVKDFPFHDVGNAVINGAIEVCIYVKNLSKQTDQSTPNLERIKELTNVFLPILNDGLKYSTAVVSTKSTTVRHKEINSFYQSIICETISITNKSEK